MRGNNVFQLLPATAEKNREGVCQGSEGQLVKALRQKPGSLTHLLRMHHISLSQSPNLLGPHCLLDWLTMGELSSEACFETHPLQALFSFFFMQELIVKVLKRHII